MLNRILCVDDEPNVLQAFERQLRKQFDVVTAIGPEAGLRTIVENGPFAVVVSDLRMPEMDGIEFLTRVKTLSPDTTRVMLTGQADLTDAISAVNRGNIFQFLTKPCGGDALVCALQSALDQHRLVTAERELLERTLHGSIGVLSEVLSLVNPPAFSTAQRIRRYVRHMAKKLDLPDQWQYEMAAMLCQIGCVSVPPSTLKKSVTGHALSQEEHEILSAQSRVGQKLLAQIPRLDSVAQMVAGQQTPWNGNMAAPGTVKLGAHLLKVALDFDRLTWLGSSMEAALAKMRHSAEYHPQFVSALEEIHLEESQGARRRIRIEDLRTQMVIDSDVFAKNGLLLLAKGQEVTTSAIERLMSFSRTVGVIEPITVVFPNMRERAETGAVESPEAAQEWEELAIGR